MADGTERDSLDGYEIPYNEQTEQFYRVIADIYGLRLKSLEEIEKERGENGL
jgi:hypothetical protein